MADSDVSYGFGTMEEQRQQAEGHTTAGLSDTLCAALKALLREEMDLATLRQKENMQALLLAQDQRLRAAMLPGIAAAAAAARARAASGEISYVTAQRSPRSPRSPQQWAWPVAQAPSHATDRVPPVRGQRSGRRGRQADISPEGESGTKSHPSPSASCASPSVSAAGTAPTCRTTNALLGGMPSPLSVDEEAPASPSARSAGRTAELTRVVSLNSRSPAGALEWRRHMRGHISSKISARKTGVDWMGWQRTCETLETFLGPLNTGREKRSKFWAERVVDSTGFEMLCSTAIVVNSIIIGLTLDAYVRAQMGEIESADPICFHITSSIVLAALLLEIVFRIFAKRWKYLFGKEWKWNITDVLLAAYSVIQLVVFQTYQPCFQIVRTVRLVRAVRAMSYVHIFRDIRLMLCSLSQSLVSLFSALVLLLSVIYLFSICFMHAAASYVREGGEEDVVEALRAHYGNLSLTMFTLLLAISNGADWKQMADPLGKIHWSFELLFIFYVLFVVIGVLNVLTSVFVERARELSRLDREMATQGELASQEVFLAEMRTIFEEVDDEEAGRITWQKFRDYLKNDRAQAFFATQQLDTSDAARLFSLLEQDEEGAVKIEEFALGCMRLRGPAKSSDVAALLKEARVQRRSARELRRIGAQLERLCRSLYFPDDGCALAGSVSASHTLRSTGHAQIVAI
ncbi:unnamed protein product [Prorocentrum cordatum]|uniref:Ion transport domain-containing protein n=1 Tax=Prorocentrum cordatum TaxID=2364126 RepID=A0ABN9UP53_9DINO|nr:unnamed protein product [Polarella glacialis]